MQLLQTPEILTNPCLQTKALPFQVWFNGGAWQAPFKKKKFWLHVQVLPSEDTTPLEQGRQVEPLKYWVAWQRRHWPETFSNGAWHWQLPLTAVWLMGQLTVADGVVDVELFVVFPVVVLGFMVVVFPLVFAVLVVLVVVFVAVVFVVFELLTHS